jgi:hypothetical protein
MKHTRISAFAVALLLAALTAHAQTYQWKDSAGRTIISDTPPPGTAKSSRALGTSPAPASEAAKTEETSKPADAPKSTAEKDMEFKKRQQDAKEKADKEAKEKATEEAKRDNCERARRNLAALESNQAITSLDANGQRQVMDTTQRQQEMERARKIMADSCK